MDSNEVIGKKIFFLHPQSVIQDELVRTLIMNEYEAYVLKDHRRAYGILKQFPDSIMFINIDEGLREPEWEEYIKKIQTDGDLTDVRLGILSYNTDQELMRKYLMDMSIPCGYIQLKLGIKESTKIILDALKANEAKGRRKYIRVSCEEDESVTLNYRDQDRLLLGKVLDLSSAGSAFRSDAFSAMKPKSLLRKIQFKLRGSLVLVDGILMGNRRDSPDVYVLLFDPNTDPAVKATIQKFIMQSLQRFIDTVHPQGT